jgi:quercetin dioxygenase-like cupin family protein
MSAFAKIESIVPRGVWPGVVGRVVEGQRLTVAVVELAPDAIVPAHEHENEQIGFVIEGSITATVGDETAELRAGGTYSIPAGCRHELRAGPQGTVVADIFAPPRAEWAALERLSPESPRWPRQ